MPEPADPAVGHGGDDYADGFAVLPQAGGELAPALVEAHQAVGGFDERGAQEFAA